MAVSFESNGKNEIFFVDGAESSLKEVHFDALTSASAHFLKSFKIKHEVDVYISRRSELESIVARTRAYHMPPSFDRDNSIVCVFLNPDSSIEQMIVSLAHEMIHVWQVERGDLIGNLWKGHDLQMVPYEMRPWELEAFGSQEQVASWFFEDKIPSESELIEITEKTDLAFDQIIKSVAKLDLKKKLFSAAKIVGAVGVGALIGL